MQMTERILVVDDNDSNRSMLVDVLTQWGYTTAEAKHGKVVMKMVEELAPDLILLDVMLPGMNGYEICQQLKQGPETENIPVIMLTVLDDSESRARGISVGASLFVSRPFNYKELHKNIESLLLKKQKRRNVETLQSLCNVLENVLQAHSTAEYERYLDIFGYAKRVVKVLGLNDDTTERISIGTLLCSLRRTLDANRLRNSDMKDIIKPLNMSTWLIRYLEYQENPDGGNTEDVGAIVLYICTAFHDLRQSNDGSDTATLKALEGQTRNHPQQIPVFQALQQTLNDEAFLVSLKTQTDSPQPPQ